MLSTLIAICVGVFDSTVKFADGPPVPIPVAAAAIFTDPTVVGLYQKFVNELYAAIGIEVTPVFLQSGFMKYVPAPAPVTVNVGVVATFLIPGYPPR
jgi:hypothetical protein